MPAVGKYVQPWSGLCLPTTGLFENALGVVTDAVKLQNTLAATCLPTTGLFENALGVVTDAVKLQNTLAFNVTEFYAILNLARNGGAHYLPVPVKSDSAGIVSERRVLDRLRELRPLILIFGPVCAIEILFIACSVVSHKSPEARQEFFDTLTIISIVLAMMPAFNCAAGRSEK